MYRRVLWMGRFRELKPIAPWITGVKAPADPAQCLIPDHLDSRFLQSGDHGFDPAHRECQMGFNCRPERVGDPNMQLPRSYPEPASASRAKRLWLFDLGQPKQ